MKTPVSVIHFDFRRCEHVVFAMIVVGSLVPFLLDQGCPVPCLAYLLRRLLPEHLMFVGGGRVGI